eukprot:450620-Prorocentrum_minimum.AAC.1
MGGDEQSYLDKILKLADERSEAEGRLSEAQRAQRSAETMQARLEQEKERLKHHSDWLDKELTQKSETLLEQRKAASDEVRFGHRPCLDGDSAPGVAVNPKAFPLVIITTCFTGASTNKRLVEPT